MLAVAVIVLAASMISVNANDLPALVSFSTPATIRIVRGAISLKGYDVYVVFADFNSDDDMLHCFHEAADRHKDKILFIHSKKARESEDLFEHLMIEDPSSAPVADVIRIVDPREEPPIIYPVEFGEPCSADGILAEVKKFRDGSLDPVSTTRPILKFGDAIKSSEETEDSKVLIADEFASLVLKRTSVDTIVWVHDPMCTVCIRSLPVWEQVVRDHAHVGSLELYSMDGRSNEVRGLRISQFPTLLLFPAFDKEEYQTFKGPRQVKDISTWIHQKVAHRFALRLNEEEEEETVTESVTAIEKAYVAPRARKYDQVTGADEQDAAQGGTRSESKDEAKSKQGNGIFIIALLLFCFFALSGKADHEGQDEPSRRRKRNKNRPQRKKSKGS